MIHIRLDLYNELSHLIYLVVLNKEKEQAAIQIRDPC